MNGHERYGTKALKGSSEFILEWPHVDAFDRE